MNTEVKQLNRRIEKLKSEIKLYKQNMIELKQRSDTQDTLNEILNISLMRIPLHEQMNKILLIVVGIDWLSLEKKGCVFLTDATGQGLQMVAHHNLGKSLLLLCEHIKFGECLCGIAAKEKTLVFRDCIEHDHHIKPDEMKPHGHYNVPIVSDGETLGVLNLYVKHGHLSTGLEQDFLSVCAKAMASIIALKKVEEQLHKLSYLDELTGIPNRRQFMNHLDDILIESEKRNRSFSVLFIDLDNFKAVNDQCGHDCGDKLLIKVSRRIIKCLRKTDVVARLGGDEFVVILEVVSSVNFVIKLADSIIQAISKPYDIDGFNPVIGASIGISLFPHHDNHSDGLLRKADSALYHAKENRGKAVLYTH